MPFLTVCVVVINSGQVLLTKRTDFHIWCLPSGGVEDGESISAAALRETLEETGLEVRLTRLVGIYSRPADTPSGHAVVFAAVPVGGETRPQPGETLEVRFFSPDEIPAELSFGHRRRIQDALDGVSGAAVIQRPAVAREHKPGRGDLYALRDKSGLPPEQFYMEYFRPDQVIEERFL
jgi:ADP-ribose pyrophosphatase YjhB (NUDIX family)